MSAFPTDAYAAEIDARMSLLETQAMSLDRSDVAAIAREAVSSELGQIATELQSLREMALMQAKELEVLRKERPPDVLATVMGAVEPVVDELIALERRVEPIAVVAETAQAAKNAAASAVRNAEIALLSSARTFVFGS